MSLSTALWIAGAVTLLVTVFIGGKIIDLDFSGLQPKNRKKAKRARLLAACATPLEGTRLRREMKTAFEDIHSLARRQPDPASPLVSGHSHSVNHLRTSLDGFLQRIVVKRPDIKAEKEIGRVKKLSAEFLLQYLRHRHDSGGDKVVPLVTLMM